VCFPGLAGVAITSIIWGVVHLTLGFAVAAISMRVPLAASAPEPS
jgi:bile acid:Na+ symporter, BASS family